MAFKNQGYGFIEIGIKNYAPTQSGVYGIYARGAGTDFDWIYVGETKDIQERLLEHVRGKGPEDKCIASFSPSGFAFEVVRDDGRLARQNELIRELQPHCNIQGRG